ncbi:hypothetical protein ABZ922_38775 [Streptomyces shenzhenensis]|uniref:hypothetical protein n=1 Tax=Streptomyces shenzhenensis TaxID=943815 RepID=UPI0033E33399
MKLKTFVAAAVVGVAALMPSTALAATGGFYWSPDGSGIQSASLQNPRTGHCYTLRGTHLPFYAYNGTKSTVKYYSSARCSGSPKGELPSKLSGNVTTRYVKFF